MKKIILLAIVAISFSITGCSDFLDTENLTKKDSSNYPQTEEDARELLMEHTPHSTSVRTLPTHSWPETSYLTIA